MELESAVSWTKVEAAADFRVEHMPKHAFIKFPNVQVDFDEFHNHKAELNKNVWNAWTSVEDEESQLRSHLAGRNLLISTFH